MNTNDTLRHAVEAMKRRRYDRAIELFDEHLEQYPADLKPLMQVGICHLLNGAEDIFLHIYKVAARLIADSESVSSDVHRLWQEYGTLARKVTGTALVMSTLALAGCDDQGVVSAHKYSGGVYRPPAPPAEQVENEAEAEDKPTEPQAQPAETTRPPLLSAHRYSGGVAVDPKRIERTAPAESKTGE